MVVFYFKEELSIKKFKKNKTPKNKEPHIENEEVNKENEAPNSTDETKNDSESIKDQEPSSETGQESTAKEQEPNSEKSDSKKKKKKDKKKKGDSSKEKPDGKKRKRFGKKKKDRELTPQEKRTQEILELAKLPTPQKKKRRRRQKIATYCMLGVAIIGMSIFAIVAFAGQYSGTFTIQMYKGPDCDISLGYTPNFKDGDSTTFLYADGLNNADVISCDVVSKYMNEEVYTIDANKLSGSHNLSSEWEGILKRDPESDELVDYALCYTFYIKNNNKDNPAKFKSTLQLHNYVAPENSGAINPLEYLRVRIYKNNIENPNQHNFSTWGMLTDTGIGTVESQDPENLDLRECIGKATNVKAPTESYHNGILREPYTGPGINEENIGYCEPFSLSRDQEYRGPLIEKSESIPKGETHRYTVLLWLEGDDPSCRGHRPQNVSLDLQMIFRGE